MIRLTQNDWRIFRRLQRKHKVSTEFLRYNLENIEKFIWFETWPRIVIRRYAVRKENRVFITYYRLRRVLFDQSNRKMFKRMRQNIRQWSKRIVAWRKNHLGIKEYVEEVAYEDKSREKDDNATENSEATCNNIEDVSKQLKEQLELLKTGRRPQSLITQTNPKEQILTSGQEKQLANKDPSRCDEEKQKSDNNSEDDVVKTQQLINVDDRRYNTVPLDITSPQDSVVSDKVLADCSALSSQGDWQINLESTPEKQITTQENIQPVKQLDTDEKTEKSHTEASTQQTEKLKTGLNFLDMLMCKVSGNATGSSGCVDTTSTCNAKTSPTKENECLQRAASSGSLREGYQHHNEHSMDSTDEFLGFDDCERIPGMLMTPIVPHSSRNSKNSAFVSESLNEYMRLNDLETNYSIDEDKTVTRGKIYAKDMEGLMTPKTKPPYFDMPAVPENLLKFRTVAERKQYLQKFSKNHRLAIINNEASVYRELQRRIRTQKVKSASQILAQSPNSSMSFTRNGWNAASFINTEFNKYYYQILDVDHGSFKVRLRGSRGNNDEFNKIPYVSRVTKPPTACFDYCADDKVWQYLKPVKTITEKNKKLHKNSIPSVFKPCPLSHKTFQKPLDDDTAALLLAGGSMAVVRMPTVELEVFPEYGKPLNEIAKRYLQYILPHHDISREWAEFSVSTLQQPKTLKEAEQAAAKSFNSRDLRRSYTFVIPYLNDRNHILVRRVVDRSEKLDESFEQCVEESELVPKTDFSFRKNLDLSDDVLLACSDVVSDMINTVAISCSENSFIKIDPDGLNNDDVLPTKTTDITKQEIAGVERSMSSPNAIIPSGSNIKKPKKQNSLLLELKRLNATIIDAAIKSEIGMSLDKKPCSKDYCQMGCICVSLAEIAPIREHCGKTKCMLECTCKLPSQSRILRLETDGRTLTTEDAFMLRRKATARLARMEKEFTSTVVLTENETLLINETNNDKKRRCTKAPKRYEDFTDTEDEQRKNSPKKTALTTIDKEKHLAVEVKEVHEPVYVKDSTLEQLKHCTVNLVPLQDMDNIAIWCMVHNLYKCFCNGRAVEGKPMVIEKEDVNTTIEHDDQHKTEVDYIANVKPKYTFDKVETKKMASNDNEGGDGDEDEEKNGENATEDIDEEDQGGNDDGDDWMKERKRKRKESKEVRAGKQRQVEQPETIADSEESVEDEYTGFRTTKSKYAERQSKRGLHDVRKRFYTTRLDSCRRHIPTPRRMFLYCNRRRRLSVLKYIKENENDQTRLLLNEHVMRSVYYHKIDSDKHKQCDSSASSSKEKSDRVEKSNCQVFQPKQTAESVPQTDVTKKKFLLVNEIVDLLDDEDDDTITATSITNKNKDDNSQRSSSTTKSCSSFEAQSTNHFQICSSGGVITVKKCSDIKNSDKNRSTPSTSSNAAEVREIDGQIETETATETGVAGTLKLPKIASCFSLNLKANAQKPTSTAALNEEQCLDFSSATSVHSAAFSQNPKQQPKNSQNSISAVAVTHRASPDTPILDMDNENVRDVYNNVIKTMNSLVSKKMQDIDCALQRESHIIPTPNPDILCIMRWSNFLDAFCEGFAYIWQVKIKEITFFAITIQNVMPLIIGAMGIVNITALKAEKMPLMGKMLLQKFRNKETEKLAVVMQGKQSHWVVKGFLNADPAMACNKPTPNSHPSLTKKINVLCSLLVKQRQKDQKKKEKLTSPWGGSSSHLKPILPTQQPPQAPKIAQIMPTRRIITVHPKPTPTPAQTQNSTAFIQIQQPTSQPLSLSQSQLQSQSQSPTLIPPICAQNDMTDLTQKSKQIELNNGKITATINSRKRKADNTEFTDLLKMDSYSKMSSNIQFRGVTQSDIDEIFLPELHKLDHKWLVLDLHNDFSHIFVPDFRDLVSLDRIQKVINFARQKSKIVKLQFFQNAPFDAFVTPKSIRKIYFGPLTTNMKAPILILLQSVDGQMMLRELYQLQHNIVKKPEERTKAFWLVNIKGQTHFEMNVNVINESSTAAENTVAATSTGTPALGGKLNDGKSNSTSNCSESAVRINNEEALKNVDSKNNIIVNDDDDDEDDCIIIDDTKDTVVNLMPQPNLLATPSPIQSAATPIIMNGESTPPSTAHLQSVLKVPNTNTIIKPISPSNMSGPVIINVPPMPPTKNPLPILTLPPNTIITGINPPASTTNASGSQVVNIPKSAIITGIESAPPDAPYSSTIFITSSPSSTAASTVAATTPSTATISNATITSNSSSSQSQINARTQENQVKSVSIKPSAHIMRQALEAGSIKRRRISLFCSNKYDKISENIAVDAVIRKILPGNAQDIQINPSGSGDDENNASSLSTPQVVTTVGSTQISKITSNGPTESKIVPAAMVSATIPVEMKKPKAPIVFDVNFMDDGDEPTASIVIKPSSSTATSSTATLTTSKLPTILHKTVISRATPLNTSPHIATPTKLLADPNATSEVTGVTSTNTNTNANTGFTEPPPPLKKMKLPTLFNSTPAVSAGTKTTLHGKGKLINSLLCTKQPKIVPQFSTPKPIMPKLSSTAGSSLPNLLADNSDDNSPTPFPFRRSTISLKVQKVQKVVSSSVAPTSQSMQPIATTATITTNPTSPASTLTVKQVQDMLNRSKPGINVAAINPRNSSSSVSSSQCISSPMPQKYISTIKATITPARVTAVSTASSTITPASPTMASASASASALASGSVVSSVFASSQSPTSSAPETTSLNPTLTISKVQSFGSSQKSHNSDQIVPTFIPAPAQIVNNDLNDIKVPAPIPPSHIQYGYIVSATHANQKFVAKRVADEFYVKVPTVGILKLQGLAAVKNYLNKYVNKTLKDTQNLPAVWQFVAASKAVQMQNHQKALLVRKTKSTSGVNTGTAKNIASNSNNSLEEPILIDD